MQRVPVEHLVLDPGSNDDSRAIAASSPSVQLIAEPDDGQSDAVRRGWALSSREIVGWLNADDRLADVDVVAAVLERFDADDKPDLVYGRGRYTDHNREFVAEAFVETDVATMQASLVEGVGILQPAVFLRRRALDRLDGGPRTDLNYAMDYELWIRASNAGLRFACLDRVLAEATIHPEAKTQSQRGDSLREAMAVAADHFGFVAEPWARKVADWEIRGEVGLFTATAPEGEIGRRVAHRTRQLLRKQNGNWPAMKALLSRPTHRAHQRTILAMFGVSRVR